MKIISLILAALMLTGCGIVPVATVSPSDAETAPANPIPVEAVPAPEYSSRYDSITEITLSDSGITVNGGGETEAVFTSHDILYYETRETYESGNPYGEGTLEERHTAAEAEAHTVVNITAPGAYRVSGKLSVGQLRIDLGEKACDDPEAVVELILSGADITCTVAPAIVFLNTYECDSDWSTDTAKANVDTAHAGANLILEGINTVSGSHVAKIFQDKEGEKKLWKQDGAIYSYMSINIFGPGNLDLTADNEGLGSELHLTINGGNIAIRSGNDGINTNEDGVSVTTINGGSLHIIAGLGAEGDGIDSNGYLVINGGTVVSSANPASDAGLDSDLGSYIHGGTVIALGSTMDWAESDSSQVTMNLQFQQYQQGDSAIVVTKDGNVIFAYDPSEDEVLGENARQYMGAILSCPNFFQGETYEVYLNGTVTGNDAGGVYDVSTVTGYEGGIQQAYSGNDLGRFGGSRGGFGGKGFDGTNENQMPPEVSRGQRPEMPEGVEFPGRERPEMPEGMEPSREGFPGLGGLGGASSTEFFMADKVNAFSGVAPAEA